ncbi:DNA primase [bacterium]|nr:DNA primase [bacterium]
MKSFISPSKVDEIIEKLNIVDVVSEYVKLKKTGKNFKALCPFHEEKTPSFFVSPEKQIFHCFGCGTGGNVIKFLMDIEKISFPEAIKLAAKKAGVDIEFEEGYRENKERKEIIKANEYALKIYSEALFSPSGKVALEYLYERNFDEEKIKRFCLGFAPSGKFLLKRIIEDKLDKTSFIKAGLINEEGEADIFRNRIIFPIFNWKGEVAGFGGRVLDDGIPKYLNTSENIVFDKSKLLYGINWAKDQIKNKGFAIIVEGYFDVLKLISNGIENCVAPMGTSLTSSHLRFLKRYTDRILLTFDTDEAGIRASLRNLENILREGFEVKVCVLPSGFDPDNFIDEYGIEAFENLLNQSQDFLDFLISVITKMYDMNSPRGKSQAVKECLKFIALIPDEIERDEYLKKLSLTLEVEKKILEEEIEEIAEIEEKSFIEENLRKTDSFIPSAETLLLEVLLSDEKYWENFLKWKGKLTERMEKVLVAAETLFKRNMKPTPSNLINNVEDEEVGNWISSVAINCQDKNIEEKKRERIYMDCIKKLRKISLKKKIDGKIKNGIHDEELEELQSLLYELKKE